MKVSDRAVHRTIVAVDVEAFGDPQRTLPHQTAVRAAMYTAVRDAFETAGIAWDRCHVEDRGDGIFVLVPSEFPKSALVEVVPGRLASALRAHNEGVPDAGRIRLRMAVNAGEVVFDAQGATSTSITTTFRFLDLPALKAALRASPGVLALVVSPWIFDEVVRHSTVVDPSTFRRVDVEVKELSGAAWISLPDRPFDADPGDPPPAPAAVEGVGAKYHLELRDNKGVQIGDHGRQTNTFT